MLAGRDQAPQSTEQGVSRKFKEFMRKTQQAQTLDKKSRKQKKEFLRQLRQSQQLIPEGSSPLPAVPEFQQKKGETEAQFMRRMDMDIKHIIRESQIEAKFKDDKKPAGEEVQKRSAKKKEKDKEKKQAKKVKQREKKEDRQGDFRKFTDKVEFGEVVHAPPTLSVLPKHAKATEKPWVKSLLANDILRNNAAQNAGVTAKSSSQFLGKGTKRKLLSRAQQVRMDVERQHAIETYRQMKKSTVQ